MNGGDDLLRVDPLEVGAGGREVRVPELALDQRQRDPFMEQLDSVGMAELMRAKRRRTPASRATLRNSTLTPLADHARPRVGPSITQNNGPTGRSVRSVIHGASVDHAHVSIPTSRRLSFFPCVFDYERTPRRTGAVSRRPIASTTRTGLDDHEPRSRSATRSTPAQTPASRRSSRARPRSGVRACAQKRSSRSDCRNAADAEASSIHATGPLRHRRKAGRRGPRAAAVRAHD
jgi:hypothetical protein